MEEITEQKISKYSSGINKLIRLNNLWNDVNTHSRNGKFEKWNEDLDCIWSELSADLSDDDFKTKEESWNVFDSEILDIGQINDKLNDTFNKIGNDELLKRSQQYKKLREKESFLRRLENEVGMGTTYRDEEEDEF